MEAEADNDGTRELFNYRLSDNADNDNGDSTGSDNTTRSVDIRGSVLYTDIVPAKDDMLRQFDEHVAATLPHVRRQFEQTIRNVAPMLNVLHGVHQPAARIAPSTVPIISNTYQPIERPIPPPASATQAARVAAESHLLPTQLDPRFSIVDNTVSAPDENQKLFEEPTIKGGVLQKRKKRVEIVEEDDPRRTSRPAPNHTGLEQPGLRPENISVAPTSAASTSSTKKSAVTRVPVYIGHGGNGNGNNGNGHNGKNGNGRDGDRNGDYYDFHGTPPRRPGQPSPGPPDPNDPDDPADTTSPHRPPSPPPIDTRGQLLDPNDPAGRNIRQVPSNAVVTSRSTNIYGYTEK